MSLLCRPNVFLSQLRHDGCLRIRAADDRQVPHLKFYCLQQALRLGSDIVTSYRRPWLYVMLNGRRPAHETLRA